MGDIRPHGRIVDFSGRLRHEKYVFCFDYRVCYTPGIYEKRVNMDRIPQA